MDDWVFIKSLGIRKEGVHREKTEKIWTDSPTGKNKFRLLKIMQMYTERSAKLNKNLLKIKILLIFKAKGWIALGFEKKTLGLRQREIYLETTKNQAVN